MHRTPLLVALAAVVGCAASAPAETTETTSSALTDVADFGDNPGKLEMHVYAPSRPAAQPAVVVALHGCTQGPADYENVGWDDYAEKYGFYVVYPGEPSSNNATRCFRWYDAAQTARGQGEAASIAQMVAAMKAKYGVKRAFVTGLSAGGAMTAALLAAYPDVFEAGAIFSGLPASCAKSQLEAFSCMSPGVVRDAKAWGDLARAASGGWSGPWPRVAIWHGDADYTVRPANLDELVKQWTNVNGLDAAHGREVAETGAKHVVYADASGASRVESFLVTKMGHGTPVDPAHGCGKAGAFVLAAGICSTERAVAFFGLDGSTPAPGATPGASSLASADPRGGASGGSGGGCGVARGPLDIQGIELGLIAALVLGRRRRRTVR
jgi:poly(hydroxyalkanoate) depolymerase family esterase